MNISGEKFSNWLRSKNLKERSIENYMYYFNKFIIDYPGFNQEYVNRFLASKSNMNSIARSFLVNFQKYIKVNFKEIGLSEDLRIEATIVELPKLTGRVKQRIIKPLSNDEILLLEKNLDTEALKLQLLISYYCGLRLGELLKINILSFNWDQWKKDPGNYAECRVYGKGDKEGIAFVPPELMVRLKAFIKENNFSSVNSKLFLKDLPSGHSINIKNRSRIWQQKLRQAGIRSGITKLDNNKEVIKETAVHPHRLRHSFGKLMLVDKKFNMKEVQELMRHASIQSTQVYVNIDKEHLKEKLQGS